MVSNCIPQRITDAGADTRTSTEEHFILHLKGYSPVMDGFAEQRANERKQLAIVAVLYLIRFVS